LGLVLYASDDVCGIRYDGDGRAALEVGAREFEGVVAALKPKPYARLSSCCTRQLV